MNDSEGIVPPNEYTQGEWTSECVEPVSAAIQHLFVSPHCGVHEVAP